LRWWGESERRAELGTEEFRLFPRREVTALVDLVEIDELVITTLGPASWRTVDLAGKDRHGSRDGDVHGVEVVGVVLPVEPRGRDRTVREPVERDVIEHLVFRE
jgi:hypothetical protein